MAGARALVHAARLEPFGYTPLEAAAAGVPAIVVAEGGMRETVRDGDTGWVAEPTAPALAAAIASCLADPKEAARRSSRARAEALSRWSVAAAIGRLEQHLAAVATAAPVASGR
jgi:glycosyltransferase involved in cell wall biosynthesis